MAFKNSWILFFLVIQFGLWIYIFLKNRDTSPIFLNQSKRISSIIKKNMNYNLFSWKSFFIYAGIFF